MARIIRRSGAVEERGESISEFKTRQTRKRIVRRGVTQSEVESERFKKKTGLEVTDKGIFLSGGAGVSPTTPQTVIETRLGKSGTIVTKSDGSRVVRSIVGGKVFDRPIPRGTRIITKRSGQRVAQRIIKGGTTLKKIVKEKIIDRTPQKIVAFSEGIQVPAGKARKGFKKFQAKASEGITSLATKSEAREIRSLKKSIAKEKAKKRIVAKGFQKRKIERLEKELRELEKTGFTPIREIAVDIAQDIVKHPVKNVAIALAGFGIGKVVKVVKGSKTIARIASKVPVAQRGIIKGGAVIALVGAYGAGVVKEGKAELASTGKLTKTIARELRIIGLLGIGQKIGARPTRLQKAEFAQAKKLISRLSSKDRLKLNSLSKSAREQITLVEKLKGVKIFTDRQTGSVIGKGGLTTTKRKVVLETITKLSKAKSIKIPKKVGLVGKGSNKFIIDTQVGSQPRKVRLKANAFYDPKTKQVFIESKKALTDDVLIDINKMVEQSFKNKFVKVTRKPIVVDKVINLGKPADVVAKSLVGKPDLLVKIQKPKITFLRKKPVEKVVKTTKTKISSFKDKELLASTQEFEIFDLKLGKLLKPTKTIKTTDKTLGLVKKVVKKQTPRKFKKVDDRLVNFGVTKDNKIDSALPDGTVINLKFKPKVKTKVKAKVKAKTKPIVSATSISGAFPTTQTLIPFTFVETEVITGKKLNTKIALKPVTTVKVQERIVVTKPVLKVFSLPKVITQQKTKVKTKTKVKVATKSKVKTAQAIKPPLEIQVQKQKLIQKTKLVKPLVARLRIPRPKKPPVFIPFLKFKKKKAKSFVSKKLFKKQVTLFSPTLVRPKKKKHLLFTPFTKKQTGLELR